MSNDKEKLHLALAELHSIVEKNHVKVIDDSSNVALHMLTRKAEQALKAQQNNQNAKAKPEETKK